MCPTPDGEKLIIEPVAGDFVERAEGLIHQEDVRLALQGACNRNALALPARKLVWIAIR